MQRTLENGVARRIGERSWEASDKRQPTTAIIAPTPPYRQKHVRRRRQPLPFIPFLPFLPSLPPVLNSVSSNSCFIDVILSSRPVAVAVAIAVAYLYRQGPVSSITSRSTEILERAVADRAITATRPGCLR